MCTVLAEEERLWVCTVLAEEERVAVGVYSIEEGVGVYSISGGGRDFWY